MSGDNRTSRRFRWYRHDHRFRAILGNVEAMHCRGEPSRMAKGVIFDFDGVLADTEPVGRGAAWRQEWLELASERASLAACCRPTARRRGSTPPGRFDQVVWMAGREGTRTMTQRGDVSTAPARCAPEASPRSCAIVRPTFTAKATEAAPEPRHLLLAGDHPPGIIAAP
jgi:phosphoglycolate phosphatase-like HAD superfamily hydrolase